MNNATAKQNKITTGGGLLQSVSGFLSGVVSANYIVRMIHVNRSYVISRYWNHDQIIANIPLMTEKNRKDFHIYIRPSDDKFVLLDDLRRCKLQSLAELKPCLLMETSPGNFQAWLKLRNMPQERTQKTQIWKTLAAMFDADPGSAKPDQIGRLPGFYNVKEKYAPDYPLVKLHRYDNRYSTFDASTINTPDEQAPPPVVKMNTTSGHTDRSGFDWAVACDLVKKGWTDDKIRRYLEQRSHKAATRKDNYIDRTIAAARRKFKIQ